MQYGSPYASAKKKVKKIKDFYRHVVIYIVVNIALLILKGWFLGIFSGAEPEFTAWVYLNILSTPLIWGAILLTHGLYIYSLQPKSLIKKWEMKQIKKIMDADESNFRNTTNK